MSRRDAPTYLTDEEVLAVVLGPAPPLPCSTGGAYERLSGPSDEPHRCNPPGWWRRWRDGVKAGAVWRCSCGARYEFRPWESYRKGVGRVGQPHPGQPGFPYWWRIFEMGPPPQSARKEQP